MSWILVAAAILLEVAGTSGMKGSQGFTRPLPTAIMVVGYVLSFGLMTIALRRLDLALVYAIWSGAGTALITLIAIAFFDEPMTALKLAGIVLIVGGVVLLNLGGAH